MLKFSRTKLIGIHRLDTDQLGIHGVLDDDIYSIEVDVTVRTTDLTIVSARGRWLRDTTPDCHRALPVIGEAEGLAIDAHVAQTIHKTIGRRGCRHFANLLIECCDAATEAVNILAWTSARKSRPGLTFSRFLREDHPTRLEPAGGAPEPPKEKRANPVEKPSEIREPAPANGLEKTADGCFIDLHVHTFPASPCSSASVDHLIEAARETGLSGICLTDHNHVWDADQVAALRQKHGFCVLRGNEITTDQGDILVFGLEEDVQGIVSLPALREIVIRAGGFMIAAHPFRGFLVFGAGELGLTVEKAMDRTLFRHVDAVEVLNGKVTQKENRFAAAVAEGLGMPVSGGSDAHEVHEVGQYATRFPSAIRNETDLLYALKSGDYSPVSFRKEI